MPAPSRATSPCAEPRARRQRGAAVVLALIAVTLAATLAAAALGDFGSALESVSSRRDQAQSRQLARAAVDWTRNVLAEDHRTSAVDHFGELWTVKVPPTSLSDNPEDGAVGGEIVDLSGRFNLNELAGESRDKAHARLQRLLQILGESPDEAYRIRMVIATAISPAGTVEVDAGRYGNDPGRGARYRNAPHAPLVALDELPRLIGMDPTRFERLSRYVTVLPVPSRVNVNTAPAEVLAAMVDGLDLDAARVLVAERERAWFRDHADFSERLPANLDMPEAKAIDVRSRFFLVTIHASYGVALTRLEALLDRREAWPDILWYRLP